MSYKAIEIIKSNKIYIDNGDSVILNSSIDENEVIFIQKLIKLNNSIKSIEIGCAMGLSSLTICDAVRNNDPILSEHIIIDPFQASDWKNIGINNLRKEGFNNFTLFEERSEYILPKLAEQNLLYDFAFIDGWHTFDHTLLDFFYLNRMLKIGGIIIIDDTSMPGINRVVRLIHKYPSYKFIDSVKVQRSSSRNILELVKSIIRPVAKLFGKKVSNHLFSSSLLISDTSLGLNSSMVAFQKIAEDNRPWNWHEEF